LFISVASPGPTLFAFCAKFPEPFGQRLDNRPPGTFA
jgi:hypothetical protein